MSNWAVLWTLQVSSRAKEKKYINCFLGFSAEPRYFPQGPETILL